jgi:hypothetical protein
MRSTHAHTQLDMIKDTILMILLTITFSGIAKVVAFLAAVFTIWNQFQRAKHDVIDYHNGSWKDYFRNWKSTKKKRKNGKKVL